MLLYSIVIIAVKFALISADRLSMRHFVCLFALLFSVAGWAKEFEIFDGRMYNGLYYPLVDIIEWGDIPHIELHIHSKNQKIDVVAVPGDKNGKPVLWLMYDLKYRNERVCRHVLAPAHFKEGMKLYAYRDDSDPDYDNIYFSSQPMQGKKMVPYEPPTYEPCLDEMASNKPDSMPRAPASVPTPAEALPPAVKKEGDNIGVDYINHSVPFSF